MEWRKQELLRSEVAELLCRVKAKADSKAKALRHAVIAR